jgi:serine/threonine protein kinase
MMSELNKVKMSLNSKIILFQNKYKIIGEIGKGAFGVVYQAKHFISNENVAIKFEKWSEYSTLKHEASVYSYLNTISSIPRLRAYGKCTYKEMLFSGVYIKTEEQIQQEIEQYLDTQNKKDIINDGNVKLLDTVDMFDGLDGIYFYLITDYLNGFSFRELKHSNFQPFMSEWEFLSETDIPEAELFKQKLENADTIIKSIIKKCISFFIQGLKILREIHEMGIIHRDISPSNFFWTPTIFNLRKQMENIENSKTTSKITPITPTIPTSPSTPSTPLSRKINSIRLPSLLNHAKTISKNELSNVIIHKNKELRLIDFGMASRYVNNDGVHKKIRKTHSLIGNMLFCSIHQHKRIEPSRRDDLEMLGYTIMDMICGLPWRFEKDENAVYALKKQIYESKENWERLYHKYYQFNVVDGDDTNEEKKYIIPLLDACYEYLKMCWALEYDTTPLYRQFVHLWTTYSCKYT